MTNYISSSLSYVLAIERCRGNRVSECTAVHYCLREVHVHCEISSLDQNIHLNVFFIKKNTYWSFDLYLINSILTFFTVQKLMAMNDLRSFWLGLFLSIWWVLNIRWLIKVQWIQYQNTCERSHCAISILITKIEHVIATDSSANLYLHSSIWININLNETNSVRATCSLCQRCN